MRERPILLNAPMVLATLDDLKVNTRRLVKGDLSWLDDFEPGPVGPDAIHRCPYGKPGDRLWVRENWTHVPSSAYRMSEGVQQTVDPNDPDMAAIYAAGWDRSIPKWRPSIHMPRWASRISLEITGVSVERVQSIDETSARGEGVLHPSLGDTVWAGWMGVPRSNCPPVTAFAILWMEIYGREAWDANPWVWVVDFKRVQA